MREIALKNTNTEALQHLYALFCDPDPPPRNLWQRMRRWFRGKPGLKNMDPLELVCWLERLERWSALVKQNLCEQANNRYTAVMVSRFGDTSFPGPVPWARIEAVGPVTSWVLPADLLDAQLSLAERVATAKNTGDATKAVGRIDEKHEFLFRVGLKKC